MRNDELTPELTRRLRGQILILLRDRHNAQLTRMDDVQVTRAMQSITFEVGINDVVTVLQDLSDRGYVRYTSRRHSLTRRVYLEKIEITSAGRDQVDGNVKTDPAVEL